MKKIYPSLEEVLKTAGKKHHKYNAKRTVVNGIAFDSKRESERYAELEITQMAGEISDLELQPVFEIIPSFAVRGESHRARKYIADFKYIENGETVVEDVKGKPTAEYKLKRELFLYKYGDDLIFRETK